MTYPTRIQLSQFMVVVKATDVLFIAMLTILIYNAALAK